MTDENAEAIAEICHRLEGLPLAIELAAVRAKFLSPPTMLGRLDSRLKLLTGGAANLPARQRTLRGAIDWSYDLLDEAEQALFRRVSVFVGGFTLEAGEVVCGPVAGLSLSATGHQPPTTDTQNTLESLVDKSLLRIVQVEQGDELRFWMLETIRKYGLEKMSESEEGNAMRKRHADYYLKVAEQTELELQGPGQTEWLDLLETEHDNLRAALRDYEERGDLEKALRMSGALWQFWDMRGYLSEGRERLARLLSSAKADGVERAVYAKALNAAGRLAMRQGDYAWARQPLEESLFICRGLGDKQGMAAALNNLGVVALAHGDYEPARVMYEESLAIRKELGDKQGVASTLNNLGRVVHGLGDYAAARAFYEESLAIRKELGNKYGIALALNNLGEAARSQGDYGPASQLYEESLNISRELGDKQGIASTLNNLGHVAYHQGQLARAAALFAEGLALYHELGDKQAISECLAGVAGVASAQGHSERAARLFGAAESLSEAIGAAFDPADLEDYSRNVAEARAQLNEAAWTGAWAQGRGMTVEQAVTYALQDAVGNVRTG